MEQLPPREGCLTGQPVIINFGKARILEPFNPLPKARVYQNASKSKFQGGGLPKLAIIPNYVIAKGIGIFPAKLWHRAIFEIWSLFTL